MNLNDLFTLVRTENNTKHVAQISFQSLSDFHNCLRADFERVLCFVLKVQRNHLYAYPERNLSEQDIAAFTRLWTRYVEGEPLGYVLESAPFWKFDLKINKDVLVPRSETEELVKLVLKYLPAQYGKDKNLNVADLGTGSGAVACALAYEQPAWQIYATDISVAALKVAKANAEQLNLKNITFINSDWCQELPKKKFAAIVSNPPYVAEDDENLHGNVKKFEPHLALFAGKDGLTALSIIIHQAKERLDDNGWLFLEHGFNQGASVRELLQSSGFTDIETIKDFAGHDRVSVGRMKSIAA